jgi:DNA-binding MarR family transcriptional regulator
MPRHKREVFDELIAEVRRSQAATDRFDQAVADAAGMNRTDMRILDVLGLQGPQTAGALAAATGLTTGAMTTALDRLERAGYARRVRDEHDRRRVLVELTPAATDGSLQFYAAHMAHGERMYAKYTAAELELLVGFLRESSELNEREAERLEAENRRRPARREA